MGRKSIMLGIENGLALEHDLSNVKYFYRNNGVIPYIQLGGKILYRDSDIQKILMANYREAYRMKGL